MMNAGIERNTIATTVIEMIEKGAMMNTATIVDTRNVSTRKSAGAVAVEALAS
jgi:hypothetical protein